MLINSWLFSIFFAGGLTIGWDTILMHHIFAKPNQFLTLSWAHISFRCTLLLLISILSALSQLTPKIPSLQLAQHMPAVE